MGHHVGSVDTRASVGSEAIRAMFRTVAGTLAEPRIEYGLRAPIERPLSLDCFNRETGHRVISIRAQ